MGIDMEILGLSWVYVHTRLNVRLDCWNKALKFCFNAQIIYAWQIIWTHNRYKLNWGKLTDSMNDSNFKTLQLSA